MLQIKIIPFILGIAFAVITIALSIWVYSWDLVSEGSHKSEEGNYCESLELVIQGGIIHPRESSFALASLFASGLCVEQNFDIADSYLQKSEHSITKDMFYLGGAYELAASSENFSSDLMLQSKVSKMLRYSKKLGSTTVLTNDRMDQKNYELFVKLYNEAKVE